MSSIPPYSTDTLPPNLTAKNALYHHHLTLSMTKKNTNWKKSVDTENEAEESNTWYTGKDTMT
jgi:hypothetical protein